MKPNVVVYGLGKYYNVRKNKIRIKYHVIGHCDRGQYCHMWNIMYRIYVI